jgi:TonB family protein
MTIYKNIFFFINFCLPIVIQAQTDTIYLNNCEQPLKDKNNAAYYEVRTIKNNYEQREGFYLSGAKKYSQNFKKLPILSKNEIVVVGYATLNGERVVPNQPTNLTVDSLYYHNGSYMEWYETGEVKTRSGYFSGKQHGDLTTFHPNKKIKRQEVYNLDTLKSSRCFDSLGNEITTFPFHKNAEYAEGDRAMFQLLGKNIRYPKEARENRVIGVVVIEIFICEDNTVQDVRVKRSAVKSLDEECLRAVKLLKNWKAAQKEGVNVASVVALPIKFKLE